LRRLPSWLLGQTALRARRLGNARLADAGASRSGYSVLSALEEVGLMSQIDVGDRCGFDRSDMVAILKDLEARRVVARRSDPTDGRRNLVSITGAGRRQLRRLDMVVASIQDELLAPLSKAERRELTRLLQRVLDHYRPTDDASITPH